jgi:hypothetical protein
MATGKGKELEVSMDNETVAINLVAGYLVKNELPAADNVDIVKRLSNFYKATMDELESNDLIKREAKRKDRR